MDFWLDTPVIGSLSNNSSRIGFVIVCRSRRSGVLAGLVVDGQVEILIVLGPDLEPLATSDSGFVARFTNPLPPPSPGVCAPPTKSFEGATSLADQIYAPGHRRTRSALWPIRLDFRHGQA